MIDISHDIQSLTTFKRKSSGLMKRMRKTGRPLVLTVKGKAEAVVMDASSYQEVAGYLDAVAAIRRGLARPKKGWDVLLMKCLAIWNGNDVQGANLQKPRKIFDSPIGTCVNVPRKRPLRGSKGPVRRSRLLPTTRNEFLWHSNRPPFATRSVFCSMAAGNRGTTESSST